MVVRAAWGAVAGAAISDLTRPYGDDGMVPGDAGEKREQRNAERGPEENVEICQDRCRHTGSLDLRGGGRMVACGEHNADTSDLKVKIDGESIDEPVCSGGLGLDERQAAATYLQLAEELLPGLRPGRVIHNHHRPTVGADLDSCWQLH